MRDIPAAETEPLAAALPAAAPRTGAILAYIGGQDYEDRLTTIFGPNGGDEEQPEEPEEQEVEEEPAQPSAAIPERGSRFL